MNKTECELFLEKLADTATPSGASALLSDPHVAHCAACSEQVRQTVALLGMMDRSTFVAPPPSIRRHFYQALHEEVAVVQTPAKIRKIAYRWIAAACLLLVAGTAALYYIAGQKPPEQTAAAPVAIVGDDAVVSVAQRVNGISTAGEGKTDDGRLVATLLNILERDKNPHVRMAAFYGLVKYKQMPEVHNRLISVLQVEEDPTMQVLLINTLTETKEPRAIDAVRSVISNKKTREEVKTLALSKI